MPGSKPTKQGSTPFADRILGIWRGKTFHKKSENDQEKLHQEKKDPAPKPRGPKSR